MVLPLKYFIRVPVNQYPFFPSGLNLTPPWFLSNQTGQIKIPYHQKAWNLELILRSALPSWDTLISNLRLSCLGILSAGITDRHQHLMLILPTLYGYWIHMHPMLLQSLCEEVAMGILHSEYVLQNISYVLHSLTTGIVYRKIQFGLFLLPFQWKPRFC